LIFCDKLLSFVSDCIVVFMCLLIYLLTVYRMFKSVSYCLLSWWWIRYLRGAFGKVLSLTCLNKRYTDVHTFIFQHNDYLCQPTVYSNSRLFSVPILTAPLTSTHMHT